MSRDTWRTPPEVFAWAAGIVGGQFCYDAACSWENQLAPAMWTLGGFTPRDSLSQPWPDDAIIWCNPPYSRGNTEPFVDRALACKSLVAMLLMSPNGEARYDRLMAQSHEIAITGWTDKKGREHSGRIGFLGEDGEPVHGNTRGSSLFLINSQYGRGQRSVVTLGEVMVKGRALMEGRES